jgi:hypothetical protein
LRIIARLRGGQEGPEREKGGIMSVRSGEGRGDEVKSEKQELGAGKRSRMMLRSGRPRLPVRAAMSMLDALTEGSLSVPTVKHHFTHCLICNSLELCCRKVAKTARLYLGLTSMHSSAEGEVHGKIIV